MSKEYARKQRVAKLLKEEISRLLQREVKDVRVERLWEITEEGANAEGVTESEEGLTEFKKEHPKVKPTRFKGLGEMNPGELWDTTMNPATRTLLRVEMEDAARAEDVFLTLMGDDVAARKFFIQQNADDVRFLDI